MNKKLSRKSPEYRRRIAIGRALAKRLPQYKTQVQVAKELGMNRFAVAEIEALALYKLYAMAQKLKCAGLMDSMASSENGERAHFQNLARKSAEFAAYPW